MLHMLKKAGIGLGAALCVLVLLSFAASTFDWLSRTWGRGGPSYQPPALFGGDANTPWPQVARTSFPTYWGLGTMPEFHGAKSGALKLSCPLSGTRYRVRMPTFRGEYAATWNGSRKLGEGVAKSTVHVSISLAERAWAMSSSPDFTEPMARNARGGIVTRIEAGSDRYYCLDMATEPRPEDAEGGWIGGPLFYCAVGFDPGTQELTITSVGELGEPEAQGHRYADVTVQAGLCTAGKPQAGAGEVGS